MKTFDEMKTRTAEHLGAVLELINDHDRTGGDYLIGQYLRAIAGGAITLAEDLGTITTDEAADYRRALYREDEQP